MGTKLKSYIPMNLTVTRITLGSAAILAAVAFLSAEPTVGPLVQAYGGQGGSMNRLLNDVELTAITRAEESYLPQVNAAVNARNELVAASLASSSAVDIQAKARAVADAELALALRRADAFERLRSQLRIDISDPARMQALAASVGGEVSNGGRGGSTFPMLFEAPAGRGN